MSQFNTWYCKQVINRVLTILLKQHHSQLFMLACVWLGITILCALTNQIAGRYTVLF